MSAKLSKLADTVCMAARTYDNGKRETAIKLISVIASKIETPEERKKLFSMVKNDTAVLDPMRYIRSPETLATQKSQI